MIITAWVLIRYALKIFLHEENGSCYPRVNPRWMNTSTTNVEKHALSTTLLQK